MVEERLTSWLICAVASALYGRGEGRGRAWGGVSGKAWAEVADCGIVRRDWKPSIQSVAWLIAPIMVVMAAASAIADSVPVVFERLLGRDETAEGAQWDAAGVLARLLGFKILAADDISVV